MSDNGDPEARAARDEPAATAEPAPDDNSLEAASEEATREIERRSEGGGYGGFGDIG